MGQTASLDQEQRDQKAADAAVPVEERMNRLELLVNQPALDQVGHRVARVEEALPSAKRLAESVSFLRSLPEL